MARVSEELGEDNPVGLSVVRYEDLEWAFRLERIILGIIPAIVVEGELSTCDTQNVE